jgi:hypothetical protein
MKRRGILQVIQNLAIGVFVGISAYGVLILFFADEIQTPMSPLKSVLLGVTGVGCMVVIVVLGGMIDRDTAVNAKSTKGNTNGKGSEDG